MRGGKREIMEYASLAAEFEPRMIPIVAMWHRLTPWQQPQTTIDALVAEVGGLTPGEFFAAVARAVFEFTEGFVELVVAAAPPEVVDQTVQSAKRLNSRTGQRDRHALLVHARFLPSARPVTVRLGRHPDPPTPAVERDLPAFLREPTR
jgi:hypothetical protein